MSKATGDAIREAAEAKGVSVDDLIALTGIARATLYRKLKGHTSFTVEELVVIAAELDTTIAAIVARAELLAAA